jgi:S1-C subfamily serine protease
LPITDRSEVVFKQARKSRWRLLVVAIFASLGACAMPPRSATVSPTISAWSQGTPGSGQNDYAGLPSIKINGISMTPQAALQAADRRNAEALAQIHVEDRQIPGTVRIVLPDHDRVRPLVLQLIRTPVPPGAIEFLAESERLDLRNLADVIAHSRLFRSAKITDQNDTVAPELDGADYLIWFQVRSLTPNNAGPWFGHWEMKSARNPRMVPLALDTGTPVGVPRLESFVNSARVAVAELDHRGVIAAAGGMAQQRSNGSGIVIDAQGHVLTNNHVVAACPDLHVSDTNGGTSHAVLVASDAANDLALLKTDRHWPAWASFREARALQPGETVIAAGYPLTQLVSPDMAVTTGSLTTLTGARGDTRQFEFSAPIQPGNSGGPVMDLSGHVVGVAVSTLNGLLVAVATGGAVPQNVNFAIKSATVREFLDANHVAIDESGSRQGIGATAVAELARRFTVRVECLR